MTIDKFEIREKQFTFQDSTGADKTGTKFTVWNNRTGRKLGQHRTADQAEQQLAKLTVRTKKNREEK